MWNFDTNLTGDIVTALGLWAQFGCGVYGPSGFLQAKEMNDDPLVHNKPVNSFTNRETKQIELIGVEPFLLEIRLRDAGALIGCCDNFTRHAAEDGQLITGQNLQSTEAVCRSLEESLEESRCSHLYTH